MEVYLLSHVHLFPDGTESTKVIGIYSTRGLAEQAQMHTMKLPGFRDAPMGFCIAHYNLDDDHWQEGYVSVTHEELVRQWPEDSY